MNRDDAMARLAAGGLWDVLVIGGGATGLGVALDAAARGYRTALVERDDFAKGTSSRSTKLVHGGVRYLRSGEIGLVRGALRERGRMERNAPHLVRRQSFIIPVYRARDTAMYGLGLKAYEWLSGAASFGRSRIISVEETCRRLPTVRRRGLRGGVVYCDGQFDDARFALALAQTATGQGAAVVNYAGVEQLMKDGLRVIGARVRDLETGKLIEVRARVVVNAAGIFTDAVRQLDDIASEPMLAVSSGVHLVLDREFLPGDDALMIPETSDGRVLFAVPWHGKVVVGTTDVPRAGAEAEPKALVEEIEFLLETASRCLERPVTRADVRSIFTGLRPLVRSREAKSTASLSRDHVIVVSPSGLISVTGGKWTTYRKMAEDTVDRAAVAANLGPRRSVTAELALHGAPGAGAKPDLEFGPYGSEAAGLRALIRARPELGERLHPRLSLVAAEVVWAAQSEMARTVEDVLARRARSLFLDAAAAVESAPRVAALLAHTLGRSPAWEAEQVKVFGALAGGYLPPG